MPKKPVAGSAIIMFYYSKQNIQYEPIFPLSLFNLQSVSDNLQLVRFSTVFSAGFTVFFS